MEALKFPGDCVTKSRSKIQEILNVKMAFRFLCFGMKCLGTYPISDNATRTGTALYRLLWWFYIVNNILLFYSTMHTFFNNIENVIIACFSLMESTCMIEAIVILVHFRLQQSRMRILLSTAKNLFDNQETLVSLNNSYVYFATLLLMSVTYFSIIYLYVTRCEVTEQNVIMSARYIFSLKSLTLKIILYIHQSIVLMHTLVIVTTDGIVVLLIYICTVRLTMLKLNISEDKSYTNFKKYINEHQEILLLISETSEVAKVIIMKDVMCYMGFSISTGLQILKFHSVTTEVILHFLIICIVAFRFFICAESADNLMAAANNLTNEAYFTNWYEEEEKNVLLKTIFIFRCQKLPKIYVSGFMSAVNRGYMAMITYSTYSYFTTIRLIVK